MIKGARKKRGEQKRQTSSKEIPPWRKGHLRTHAIKGERRNEETEDETGREINDRKTKKNYSCRRVAAKHSTRIFRLVNYCSYSCKSFRISSMSLPVFLTIFIWIFRIMTFRPLNLKAGKCSVDSKSKREKVTTKTKQTQNSFKTTASLPPPPRHHTPHPAPSGKSNSNQISFALLFSKKAQSNPISLTVNCMTDVLYHHTGPKICLNQLPRKRF